ncbi:chromosome segregation protein SMC [Alphaproteobacteria bacterium]|nr:chromosome segregation protein SMC [Alphaproteobacteria bacterium]
MKFDRLRLSGFKSFVDPVDLDILPGMTGIVGPNGCGKSNLLEALRWVMGETSYKSMRGSGMEDVIFSGTNARTSRNHAEVMLVLGNQDRQAPAEYNDADELEVTRRIERDAGSAYRINGRDVRARDVQLLFADASSGARSNSLVKQGQIGELINAKPEARRLILEEAAGISGLHSRRHEAELRLRAADGNLEKLEDTLTTLETQLRQLKRQARQASRYKGISGQIREVEALALHLRWRQAEQGVEKSASDLIEIRQIVSQTTGAASGANTAQIEAQIALPKLREEEIEAASGLRRLTLEQEGLDAEMRRAEEMIARLSGQIETVQQDSAREQAALREAEQQLQALEAEETSIRASISQDESRDEEVARDQVDQARTALDAVQQEFDDANAKAAEFRARKQAFEANLQSNEARGRRLQEEQSKLENTRADIQNAMMADFDLVARQGEVEDFSQQVQLATQALAAAEQDYRDKRAAQQGASDPAREARAILERLVGERDALAALFANADDADYPALLDKVSVSAGYEAALGAALGDDLQASTDLGAPSFWQALGSKAAQQDLPNGASSLAQYVSGTDLLQRSLSQVGLVERADGARLQNELLPGQRLVSREGDVWRWDGYCATADAPTAAAKSLAQRNRLDKLVGEIAAAKDHANAMHQLTEDARQAFETAAQAQDTCRQAVQGLQQQLSTSQKQLSQSESGVATQNAKIQALETAEARLVSDMDELVKLEAVTHRDLQSMGDAAGLEHAVEAVRGQLDESRARHAEAQASLRSLQSQREARDARLIRLTSDKALWLQRREASTQQGKALEERRAVTATELAKFEAVPSQLAQKRNALTDLVTQAEGQRQAAADRLSEAEKRNSEADKLAREAQSALAQSRETQARLEATLEANKTRLDEAGQRIREALRIEPQQALAVSGHDVEKPFPDVESMENKLEKLRRERENLGGVNLRAEEEATEISTQIDSLTRERDDLAAAINKLRHGIGQLNREGRQRLLAAFETVNGHFSRLFTQLFGGGTASLELTESDDPLHAGLEIIAHPPGKKAQIMSLLSGGEQALTAMALIFAVFLTNPSPICVLDEVDAPLDDANVERFCNLVKEISEQTGTRFLVITHHALSMARMDRLFGVTMQERGVSQLLSVDLSTAEQFAETGRDKNAASEENDVKSVG